MTQYTIHPPTDDIESVTVTNDMFFGKQLSYYEVSCVTSDYVTEGAVDSGIFITRRRSEWESDEKVWVLALLLALFGNNTFSEVDR